MPHIQIQPQREFQASCEANDSLYAQEIYVGTLRMGWQAAPVRNVLKF
jgi:hypothetical protein